MQRAFAMTFSLLKKNMFFYALLPGSLQYYDSGSEEECVYDRKMITMEYIIHLWQLPCPTRDATVHHDSSTDGAIH